MIEKSQGTCSTKKFIEDLMNVFRELREKIHKAAATPHDERFKYIDYPPISTKHQYSFLAALMVDDFC